MGEYALYVRAGPRVTCSSADCSENDCHIEWYPFNYVLMGLCVSIQYLKAFLL